MGWRAERVEIARGPELPGMVVFRGWDAVLCSSRRGSSIVGVSSIFALRGGRLLGQGIEELAMIMLSCMEKLTIDAA